MDYTKILPFYIHEEIVSKFGLEEPFDLEIEENIEKKYISLTFSRPTYLNENIKSLLHDDNFMKYLNYDSRNFDIAEKEIIKINIFSFLLKDNVFFCEGEKSFFNRYNRNLRNISHRKFMAFNGNHKVYFEKNSIPISNKANNLLVDLIKKYSVCTFCKKEGLWFRFIDCKSCKKRFQPIHQNCAKSFFDTDQPLYYLCNNNCIKTCDECFCKGSSDYILSCSSYIKNLCITHAHKCPVCETILCKINHKTHQCINKKNDF